MSGIQRLTLAKLGLALECTVALAVARLMVLLIPMSTLVTQLARWRGTGSRQSPVAGAHIQRIGAYVYRMSRYTPWRSLCLEQALAAHLLLCRRGLPTALHLGVAKQGDLLTAHAWLECHGVLVTGAQGRARFTPLVHLELLSGM